VALLFCGCAHSEQLHHPAGRCTVTLPPFIEEELPAWSCPCRGFRAAPAGPWRWHAPTQTWAAAPPTSSPANVTARTGWRPATPAGQPAA
jgi:hypothetical protein